MFALDARLRTALIAFALILCLLGAQAVAFSVAPAARKSAGESLGSAGFAYLGGLRTFAAAVIWNGIDSQHDYYFSGVSLTKQTFMVPKMRLVTLLDPTFTEAYYIMSYIVYTRSGPAQGIEAAREGLTANPDSGILRANLAQLLFLHDKQRNRAEIVRLAKSAVASDSQWHGVEERFEGYATSMQLLRDEGEVQLAREIAKQLDTWNAAGIGVGSQNQNGNGK
jgi:hypothetical protein